MKKGTCNNCFWADKCDSAGERCEYYDPIFGAENIIANEYEDALKERVEDYQDIIEEQNA